VRFTTSDYVQMSRERKMKGKVTGDIKGGDVTIATGSTIETQESTSENISVTTGGYITEAKVKVSASGKQQSSYGFTVTTPSGSAKVILDLTMAGSFSESNIPLSDMKEPRYPINYSGSLKVYGEDNKLLKTVTVNNEATYNQVLKMIGYYYDYDDE